MPERILVTGAGGFLGSHICHHLGQQGHSIAAIDKFSPGPDSSGLYPHLSGFFEISLPDSTFVTLLRQFQPDMLVHCAGSASVPYSIQKPYDDFRLSVELSAFILENLRQFLPSCHFIFLSSAAVYGNPGTLPISEETPCKPISPYGYHKYMSEILCEEYSTLHGIKTSVLRIFSAYGERLRKQVIFDLCRKFSDPSVESVQVYGTGEETRDFIHASDIARTIECILKAGASGIFNVASGIQTSIREVVDIVKDSLQSNKQVSYTGSSRAGDPLYWQADISRLNDLGFSHHVSLSSGIRKYCHWFESTYEV